MKRLLPAAIAIILLQTAALSQNILIEAESFDNPGGWAIDQQFMDQMGSPFLLAHGIGVPVADATTTIALPKPGAYRIWVRTRDWVAPWDAPGAPGRFQVHINGKPLQTTFGTQGAQWHWQDGGPIELNQTDITIALHDLTGFDGRCDAILLASDSTFVPPNEPASLQTFRKTAAGLPQSPEEAGPFDLVVVGGGIAGTCAAISAARLGLDVALVQDRPVLGGNNSSEVRVHLNGEVNLPPYPALGGVVRELDTGLRGNAQPAHHYDDKQKLDLVKAEPNIHLFLNTHAFAAQVQDGIIQAITAKDICSGKETRLTARLFADCTGDGTIGFLAGADYRMGREGKAETEEALAPKDPDRMTMGASVQWYANEADTPQAFPECPWAVQFNEKTCYHGVHGDWDWETGMNHDQISEFEFIRDYGLRVVYGNWAFLKNHSAKKQGYANHRLDWVAYVAGKRESRRLLGDVILQQQDIEGRREFPDACVTTTWTIDLHYPNPENSKNFPGQEFRSIAKHAKIKPYPIPYRCLYSRNIANLMMAGRDISVTHVALGTVRVMRTGGMMGEVLGMAARLCKQHDTTPRGVYENHLDQLKALMKKGVSPLSEPPGLEPPEWLQSAGPNLARTAAVTVSGSLDLDKYPIANINDGRIDIHDNGLRWVSDNQRPHIVQLTWEQPQTLSAARIISGYARNQWTVTDPIHQFTLQYRDSQTWKDLPGTQVLGNKKLDWSATFPPTATDAIRLIIQGPTGEVSRIWELELYQLPAAQAQAENRD